MSIVEGLEMRTDILPPCRCSRQTVIAAVHGIGQCQSVLVLADNRTALGLDGFDSTSGRAGDTEVNGCGEELCTLSRKPREKRVMQSQHEVEALQGRRQYLRRRGS